MRNFNELFIFLWNLVTFKYVHDWLESQDEFKKSLFSIIDNKEEFKKQVAKRAEKLRVGEFFRVRIKSGVFRIIKNFDGKIITEKDKEWNKK